MANDIRAGGAFVEIFVRGNIGPQLDAVAKKLKSIGDSVTNLGKKFTAVGSAITAPLVLAANHFASVGSEIARASQRLGVAVESLQELKYAAEESGASFEDLENGIKKMQKAIFNAATGSKEAAKALAGIGLSVESLKGLSPEEQFATIGNALSKVQNEAARTAIAMEIFGKGGTALLPMLSGGVDGINEMIMRAKELGIVFSAEDAVAATKFESALKDLKAQVSGVIFNVGSAVAQALQPFANAAIHCMSTVIAWIKENRTLVITVLAAGVAFLAVGASLITLGLSIKAVGIAISGIRSAFTLASSAVALLMNPIVLVGVALAGLAAYFIFASDTGADVIAFLSAKFNSLADIAKEAFGGIADALAAGDISLAAKILWLGLQAAWADGTSELQKKWADFKAGLVQVAAAAFYGVLEMWENVKAPLKESWAEFAHWLKDLWNDFAHFFGDIWDTIINSVSKQLISFAAEHGAIDIDVNEAYKSADADLQRSKDQRKADTDATTKQNQSDKDNAIASARNDQKKNLKNFSDSQIELSGGADQAASDEKKAISQKEADLRKQLSEARGKAKTEGDTAKAADKKRPTLGSADRTQSLDDTINKRQNIDVKSAGTFNAAAVGSLQSGTMAAIAESVKLTAENTAYLKKLKNGTFGKAN
jgi:TP901 family phage tail tape measure protein